MVFILISSWGQYSWVPSCCSEPGNSSFQMVSEHFDFCCCCLSRLGRPPRMWLCVEPILVLPVLSSSFFLPVPSCSTFWKSLAWFRAGLVGGALAHTLKSTHFTLKIEWGVNFSLTFWCSLSGLDQWLGKDPLVSCIQGFLENNDGVLSIELAKLSLRSTGKFSSECAFLSGTNKCCVFSVWKMHARKPGALSH